MRIESNEGYGNRASTSVNMDMLLNGKKNHCGLFATPTSGTLNHSQALQTFFRENMVKEYSHYLTGYSWLTNISSKSHSDPSYLLSTQINEISSYGKKINILRAF